MAIETRTDIAPSGHVATHVVGIHSLAGSSFWALLFSFIIFLVGYSTMGWQKWVVEGDSSQVIWVGLWKNCICDDIHLHEKEAWFKASQAMFTLALLCMAASLIMLALYMFLDRIPKSVAMVVATTLCFVSFFFLFVGVCVFGSSTGQPGNGGNQSYSFILAVISMISTMMAGVLSIYHMRTIGMFGETQ